MTPTQIALLTIQIGLVLFVMSFLTAWLFKTRQQKYKYKLYAVRDELIYLVATERLSEDSIIFRVLYRTINDIISEVHEVDRWSFIRASVRARTALEEAHMERLIGEISEADPSVSDVASRFFDTMQYIVKANSPFTKLCIGSLRLFKNRSSLVSGWLEHLLPKEAYETYRYFRRLSTELVHPMI